jgi:hypothetical protein
MPPAAAVRSLATFAAVALLLNPTSASAAYVVPGTASIWLSGQPDGTPLYQNTAPAESPVLVDLVALGRPTQLTFSVSGGTARGPDSTRFPLVGGDGETPGTGPEADQAWSMPAVFDLSGYTGPYSGLVGVFLADGPPGSTPASLNFGTPSARSFAELSPLLQQVFFVGDGLTGVGVGEVQTFYVPTGATRLYLATYDSISWDNVGSLEVQVAAVPAPPSAVLLGLGIVCVWWSRRRGTPLASVPAA